MKKNLPIQNVSMPAKPIMRGGWSKANSSKVLGRWVLIGWVDAPAQPVLVLGWKFENEIVGWDATAQDILKFEPNQVLDIGPKLETCPYRYNRKERDWFVDA